MGCDTAGRHDTGSRRGRVCGHDSLWRHDRRCLLRLRLLGRWIPRSSTQISREQQGASGSGLVAEKGSCWQRCRRKISESIVIYFGGGSQRQRPYSTVGLRPVLLSIFVTKTSDVGLWSEIRLVCRKTSTKVVALLLLLLCRSLSLSNFSDDEALRRGSRLGCVVCSGSFKLDIMDRPRVALVGRETHRKCSRKTCKTKRIQHLFHRQASTVAFAGGNWSRTALGRRWL